MHDNIYARKHLTTMDKRLIWIALLLMVSNEAMSQNLSGTVIDEEQRPIVGATVFISETSIGALTDQNGFFVLTRLPLQDFSLVVSCVGYKRLKKEMTRALSQTPLLLRLESEPVVTSEITVHANNVEWKKNFERFKTMFIGTTQCAKHCDILNPQYLDFKTELNGKALTATATKPLLIENRALGYKITYQLSSFRQKQLNNYDYEFLFKGDSFFEPLTPKDIKEQLFWEENRRRVYLGSARHFFRALAKREVTSEGFEVNAVNREDYLEGVASRRLINADTLVTETALSFIKMLHLPSCIEVVFHKASFEPEFQDVPFVKRDNRIKSSWTARRKIISLVEVSRNTVFVDTLGNVIDAGGILTLNGYWSWKMIADMLPADFNPETDFNVRTTATMVAAQPVPNDSLAAYQYLIRGYSKMLAKDTVAAINDFNRAIGVAPDSATGYWQRALFHLETNNFRRANADFTTVLVLKPTLTEAYFHRGLARIGLREYDAAIDDFSEFIKAFPKSSTAYYHRGICKERLGNDEAAAADYSEAINISPTADAYFRRALIKEKYRKYLDAVLDYDNVLKLNPESTVGQRKRGEAKLLAGQRSEGLVDLALAESLGDSLAGKRLAQYRQKQVGKSNQGEDSLLVYQTAEIKVTATRIEMEQALESMKRTVVKGQNVVDFSITQRASLTAALSGLPTGLKRAPVNKSITGESAPVGLSAVSEFDCNPTALRTTRSASISVYCIVYLLAKEAVLFNDEAINELIALLKTKLLDLDLMYLAEQKEDDPNRIIQIQLEKRQIFKDIGDYLKQLQPIIDAKRAEVQ